MRIDKTILNRNQNWSLSWKEEEKGLGGREVKMKVRMERRCKGGREGGREGGRKGGTESQAVRSLSLPSGKVDPQ